MLSDFFAPANLPATLGCLAGFVLAGAVQYHLCRTRPRGWLRRLPALVCGGVAALCLVLFFVLFPAKAWDALALLLAALAALLLLLGCGLGALAARAMRR